MSEAMGPVESVVREGTWRDTLAWLRPRPAEWVILVFLGYVAVRLAAAPGGTVISTAARADFVAAVLLVASLRLGHEYFTLKWAQPGSRVARIVPATALLVIIPVGFALVTDFLYWKGPEGYGQGGHAATGLFKVYYVVGRALLMSVPLIFAWLAFGVHTKRRGRFSPVAFLRDDVTHALDVARDFFPVFVLIFAYSAMSDVLALRFVEDKDWLIATIDRTLFFGHNPVELLQAVIWNPLSEWLAFSYIAYVLWFPLCLGLMFAKRDRQGFRELSFAVTLALAVGYVTYTLVPVQGPVFTQQFSVSLDLYYANWAKEGLMDKYRIERDCFPSLHTGVTMVFLWSARRHLRPLFWAMLPIAVSIPFACVYLRYHYVTDVLAGFALAGFVAWVSPRVMRGYEQRLAAKAAGGTGD